MATATLRDEMLKAFTQLQDAWIAMLIMATLLVGGCAFVRRGGAPEPSFDVNKDLAELAQHFSPGSAIRDFYAAPSVDSRNRFVMARLTMMNIRYIQFVRQITAERQLLDSAADMLTLGLSLAGASVSAAGTKTLLAAIAAGVTGSKQIIDKNYYYEKTVPALVAQMNAERRKALIPILTGVKGSLQEYPFEQAVTDLHAYYHVGTFTGAIDAIQADAGAKERRQDEIIATLSPLSRETVVMKQNLTRAIGALTSADVDKAKRAIGALDPAAIPAGDIAGLKEQLQTLVRAARTSEQIAAVAVAFKSAGILIPE
jgi:hypothetical protein